MKNKIVCYKMNGKFILVISLHDEKDGIEYEITEEKYKQSIKMFDMKNVPSIFDECFESIIE